MRVRWDDRRWEDALYIDWRLPALLLATLFLNFAFFFDRTSRIPFSGPPLVYCALLGAAALLLVGLFYIGPAFAAQASRLPLFEIVERSLGSVPAFGFRLCCALFLSLWLAHLLPLFLFLGVKWTLREKWTPLAIGFLSGAVLLYLFATGLSSLRTNAKLALFTNKLALALVIAALVRVREGWSYAWGSLLVPNGSWSFPEIIHQLGSLLFCYAPLAFLASDFGRRSCTKKAAATIGLCGLAIPLCFAMCLAGFLDQATYATHRNLGGLANFAVALWGGDSERFIPAKAMLAAVTIFGAARLGARQLASSLSIPGWHPKALRLTLGLFVCVIATISAVSSLNLSGALEWSSRIIVAAAAVIAADFATRHSLTARSTRFDWGGLVACAAGLGAPYYLAWLRDAVFVVTGVSFSAGVSFEDWWHPWILPIYGITFMVCLIVRFAGRVTRPRTAG
jgi:hypothetical protein